MPRVARGVLPRRTRGDASKNIRRQNRVGAGRGMRPGRDGDGEGGHKGIIAATEGAEGCRVA